MKKTMLCVDGVGKGKQSDVVYDIGKNMVKQAVMKRWRFRKSLFPPSIV